MHDHPHDHTDHTPEALNPRRAMLAGLGGLAAGAFLASKANAGPLNPPPGPIAPTPGPEPRIPINSTNTPGAFNSAFRITQPGSYYLTGNIVGESNKHGLLIDARNVTVDLMGYTIQGAPGSLAGIRLESALNNVTVRNGNIDGWGWIAIDMTSLGAGAGGVVDDVHASNCLQGGIRANARSAVRNCFAIGNQGVGISTLSGGRVENCIAHQNTTHGISVTTDSAVIDCTASDNGNNGIESNARSMVARCVTSNNSGFGIYRFARGGSVLDCMCSNNTVGGIRVFGDTLVRGNTCLSNGPTSDGAGIFVNSTRNTIEENTLIANGIGLWIGNESGRNLVIRNRAHANSLNWLVQSLGNSIIVSNTTTSPTFSGNSGGTSPGTNHPFANITY